MSEFVVGEITFRTRKLNAYEQFRILNALMPLLPALTSMEQGSAKGFGDIARALSTLGPESEAVSDELFAACVSACETRIPPPEGSDAEASWETCTTSVGFRELLSITLVVTDENLGVFLGMERPKFQSQPSLDAVVYSPVNMPRGEDWLWRPVDRGLCSYLDVVNGNLQIHDIAKMNDILAVREENESRARNAAKQN